MDGLGPQIMNEANAKKESGRSRQQSKHPLLLIRSEMRSASPASGTIPQMTTTIFYGSAFAGPHFTACTPCARNSEVAAIKCICAALLGYFHTRECDQMDEKSALVATSLTGNCCRRGCGWHTKRWMKWNSLAHSLKSTSSNELRKGFCTFLCCFTFWREIRCLFEAHIAHMHPARRLWNVNPIKGVQLTYFYGSLRSLHSSIPVVFLWWLIT